MTRSLGCIVGIVMMGASTCSAAMDSVRIRFASGYPPPQLSSEGIDIEISRIPAALKGTNRPVDEYFEAIRSVLRTCEISENWQLISPDTPFVRVEIALDGRNIQLVSDRYALRPEAQRDFGAPVCQTPGQNTNDRGRAALDRILELSTERVRDRFGK